MKKSILVGIAALCLASCTRQPTREQENKSKPESRVVYVYDSMITPFKTEYHDENGDGRPEAIYLIQFDGSRRQITPQSEEWKRKKVMLRIMQKNFLAGRPVIPTFAHLEARVYGPGDEVRRYWDLSNDGTLDEAYHYESGRSKQIFNRETGLMPKNVETQFFDLVSRIQY